MTILLPHDLADAAMRRAPAEPYHSCTGCLCCGETSCCTGDGSGCPVNAADGESVCPCTRKSPVDSLDRIEFSVDLGQPPEELAPMLTKEMARKMLGHATPVFTQEVYQHLSPDTDEIGQLRTEVAELRDLLAAALEGVDIPFAGTPHDSDIRADLVEMRAGCVADAVRHVLNTPTARLWATGRLREQLARIPAVGYVTTQQTRDALAEGKSWAEIAELQPAAAAVSVEQSTGGEG